MTFPGCFKRKRSLTPATGPASNNQPPSPGSKAVPIQSEQTQVSTQIPASKVIASSSDLISVSQKSASTTCASAPTGKQITSATFTIASTETPRTTKISSLGRQAYGQSKTREEIMYGGRSETPRFPEGSDIFRAPPLPVANSRTIWSGSPGPGPYGDYKPVSVLDNRSYTRSTGNLVDFEYGSGYLTNRGTRSRPVTPCCGYGPPERTVDRMGRTGSRSPTSQYTSEKSHCHYSATGSLRSDRNKNSEGRAGVSGGGGRDNSATEAPSGRSSLSM